MHNNTPFLPKNTSQSSLALYAHFPWCVKKCPYCDFNAHVAPTRDEERYFSSIINELTSLRQVVSKNSLTSIFFGGGTPSLASPKHIEAVINTAKALFPENQGDLEVTLEVNPTTYKEHMFHDFVSAGVTRFSIGVQSLVPEELLFLGRAHNVNEALQTIEAAQASGAQISTDFIYGLPKQNLSLWKKNLQTIGEMGTDHVSAYQLTIEPGTAFFGQVRKEKWHPLDEDQQADFFEATQDILGQHGFYQYEISNFAKPNKNNILKVCHHNLHVWRYGDYLGIGAGAHGRISPNFENGILKNSKFSEKIFSPSQEVTPNTTDAILTFQNIEKNNFSKNNVVIKNKTFSNDPEVNDHLHPSKQAFTKIATRNFKIPETYMKEIDEKGHGLFENDLLSEKNTAEEILLNGLRLSEGIQLSQHPFLSKYLSPEGLTFLETHKFILWQGENDQKTLKTTQKGQLLLDSLLAHLIAQ